MRGEVRAGRTEGVGRRRRKARARKAYQLPIGQGWPRLEAALSLLRYWRGELEGESAEASGRLLST